MARTTTRTSTNAGAVLGYPPAGTGPAAAYETRLGRWSTGTWPVTGHAQGVWPRKSHRRAEDSRDGVLDRERAERKETSLPARWVTATRVSPAANGTPQRTPRIPRNWRRSSRSAWQGGDTTWHSRCPAPHYCAPSTVPDRGRLAPCGCVGPIHRFAPLRGDESTRRIGIEGPVREDGITPSPV